MSALLLFSLATGALANTASASTSTINFPASRPSTARDVSDNFVGFGFESAFLNQYDNTFSRNLVSSVAQRMSVPPVIRVGGSTGDNLVFNPSQKANTTCISASGCPTSSGATFVLGPSYFTGFAAFPNCRWTFQAPLGPAPLNLSNTMDYVTRAWAALGGTGRSTAAIALGNEVNLYDSAANYVSGALAAEQQIVDALNLTGSNAVIFEVTDMDTFAAQSTSPAWTVPQAFTAGLNKNGLVKTVSEHYYQVGNGANLDTPASLQALLMNHTVITNTFEPYITNINYLASNHPNISLILSETGSALGGDATLTTTLGAALWSVDFHLYAMSVGVSRIGSSQRPATAHGLWVPIPGVLNNNSTPQVRSVFYASPFIADFIRAEEGHSVVNLNLNSDTLSAYGMYHNSVLVR